MNASFLLLAVAIGLSVAEGKPSHATPKTLTFPLHRTHSAVNGLENLVYTIDVRIGSSGQAFNLTLDTAYHWALILQNGFDLGNLSCADGVSATRNLYDPRQSTSFHNSSYYWDWSFPDTPYVAAGCRRFDCRPVKCLTYAFVGYDVKDAFSFNYFSVQNVPFLLANRTDRPLNPRWQSDGIFPLGMDFDDALSSVFKALGGAEEISLWLNGKLDTASPGGQITFGGRDTQHCDSKWVTVKYANTAAWIIPFEAMYVGSKWIGTDSGGAQISTASPLLQMPSWVLYWAVKPFGAEYDDQLDLYTVDCGKVDVLPAIRLVIGLGFPVDYTVPAKDFVVRLSTKAGPKCALLLAEGDLIVGTQFLPKRCVHLDYANEAISFADPIA